MRFKHLLKSASAIFMAVFVMGVSSGFCAESTESEAADIDVDQYKYASLEDYERAVNDFGRVFLDLYAAVWERRAMSEALHRSVDTAVDRYVKITNIPRTDGEMKKITDDMADDFHAHAYDAFIISLEERFDGYFVKMIRDFYADSMHRAENIEGPMAGAYIREASRQQLKNHGLDLARDILSKIDKRVYASSMIKKFGTYGQYTALLGFFLGGPLGGLAAGVAGGLVAVLRDIKERERTPGKIKVLLFSNAEVEFRDKLPVEYWNMMEEFAESALRLVHSEVVRSVFLAKQKASEDATPVRRRRRARSSVRTATP